jgi:hypothetical protein
VMCIAGKPYGGSDGQWKANEKGEDGANGFHLLLLDPVGELFDDGVAEDVASDAFDFGIGGVGGKGAVEGEEEVFALADIGYALIVHAGEGVADGLALGVEDGGLERDVDMCLHCPRL